MIRRLSHSTIYVLDQDESLAFYRDKFGFEVRTDMPMGEDGGPRWLTVSPRSQPDLEIVLMPIIAGPMSDEETVERMKTLVRSGAFGVGVLETDDLRADYKRLGDQGVEFISPPTEQFHGLEAIVRDNSGNWFSLTQRKG